MEPDQQQQQKGLFTFYREQADLEDQLKLKKHFLRQAKAQKIEERERKLQNNANHNKQNSPLNEQHQDKKTESLKKVLEPRDRLIGILRKYNGKQIKKRQNLRIILESQQQTPIENTSQLKNRLQRLLDDEQKSQQYKLVMAQKANEQKFKLQCFSNRRQLMPRINPFQKLAIIPTNFKSQFQNQMVSQLPKKKSLSRQKSLANSIDLKKKDKIEGNLRSNYRYQLKDIREFIESKKVNLPKIETRANSQVIDRRNKIKLQRLGQKSMMEQIKTERLNKKPQTSLFLDSVKLATESSTSKIGQNKIYSLFIQNKQSKQQIKTKNKQIILADVLKRLKFS